MLLGLLSRWSLKLCFGVRADCIPELQRLPRPRITGTMLIALILEDVYIAFYYFSMQTFLVDLVSSIPRPQDDMWCIPGLGLSELLELIRLRRKTATLTRSLWRVPTIVILATMR